MQLVRASSSQLVLLYTSKYIVIWIGQYSLKIMVNYQFLHLLRDSLVSQKSQNQAMVSRFSAKAKYQALAYTCCEFVWLITLLNDFNTQHKQLAPLYCEYFDNQVAIHHTKNLIFHERTKYIEIDCHFILEMVTVGVIVLLHVLALSFSWWTSSQMLCPLNKFIFYCLRCAF